MKHITSKGSDISGDAGYTLVETAIALVITTIVVAAGYSSYVFMQRIVTDWQHAILVENAAHRIVRDVTRQIRRSETPPTTSRGVLQLEPDAGMMRYRLRGQELVRDGRRLHASAVRVLAFEVNTHDGQGLSPACDFPIRREEPSVDAGLPLEKKASSKPKGRATTTARLVYVRLRLAARRDTIDVCTAIQPRQPSSWP